MFVLRIIGEEKLLARDLEGYQEYLQKVRYRLVPHGRIAGYTEILQERHSRR